MKDIFRIHDAVKMKAGKFKGQVGVIVDKKMVGEVEYLVVHIEGIINGFLENNRCICHTSFLARNQQDADA